MSEFKSKFVKCPFYLDRQGDTHRIKCEGVKKGTSTQLTFVGKKENYDIIDLIKSAKISKRYFNLMKKLSFASLGLTFSWVLCYELDLIYIGKFFSVEDVALYSVCFTLINFIRNFLNVIYSPYSQRFNHYVALNNKEGYKELLDNIVKYTFPICLFICTVLCLSSRYLISFWVGNDYSASVDILAILSWYYILHFISQPGGYVCISTENYKLINLQTIINPLVFLLSFVMLYTLGVGVLSFAISKIFMSVAGALIVMSALKKWINVFEDIKVFLPLIILLIIFAFVVNVYFPHIFPSLEKNTLNLFFLILIIIVFGFIYFTCAVLLDKSLRNLLTKHIIRWVK
jgi:O-antigen/teichoic acid export membrane protein